MNDENNCTSSLECTVHGLHPVALPVACFLLEKFSFNFVVNLVGPARTSGFPVSLRHPLDQDAMALGASRRLRGWRQHLAGGWGVNSIYSFDMNSFKAGNKIRQFGHKV